MNTPAVSPWPFPEPLTEQALVSLFREDGLSPHRWSNGAGYHYSAHSHPYHKVLYCAHGRIRFLIQPSGGIYELTPGDRLDIPPGCPHSAVVGAESVTCIEAARG